MRSAEVLPVPGGPCSSSSRPAMSSGVDLHQPVHGLGDRRRVVAAISSQVPAEICRVVRCGPRRGETYQKPIVTFSRLRLRLVLRAVRRLLEHLLGQLVAGSR